MKARDPNYWQKKVHFDKVPKSLQNKSSDKPSLVPKVTIRLV